MKNSIVIVLIVLVFIGIFCFYLYEYTKKRKKQKMEILKNNSPRVKAIEQINTKYDFLPVQADYTFRKHCNRKAQLDNFNFYTYFYTKVLSSLDDFKKEIENAHKNITLFAEYKKEVESLEKTPKSFWSENKIKVSPNFCEKYEDIVCNDAMLKPTTDILISFEALYMSPKGQNSYSSKKIYKLTDLEYLIKKIDEKNASEDQQKKERSKLSPSLRFEILKRDNYKCKLCGASQEDGAKLHVDHIIPIAKGGKTEPANLQTLCERCNLGKGIKDL